MNENDKLPNFYDVLIEAQKVTPMPGYTANRPYTLRAESVEAPDPETAVMRVLRKHWLEDCIIFESEGDEGWVVAGPDDLGSEPEICRKTVTAVKRLVLAYEWLQRFHKVHRKAMAWFGRVPNQESEKEVDHYSKAFEEETAVSANVRAFLEETAVTPQEAQNV